MRSFFDLSHRVKRPNGFKYFFIAVFGVFVPIFRICAGYVHQFPADVNADIKSFAPADRAVVAKTLPSVFETTRKNSLFYCAKASKVSPGMCGFSEAGSDRVSIRRRRLWPRFVRRSSRPHPQTSENIAADDRRSLLQKAMLSAR